MKTTIVWFRQDLRIEDHPALLEACERGAVLPLFIMDVEEGKWPAGAASRWWLHYSLKSLAADLKELGLTLIIREGPVLPVLLDLIEESGASAVFWSRCYEPHAIARDSGVKTQLHMRGIEGKSFNSTLLFEPWIVSNKKGKPFQIFTPFWNACKGLPPPPPPLLRPKNAEPCCIKLKTLPLDKLSLLPKIHWDLGLQKTWCPGTKAAKQILASFLKDKVIDYATSRDRPDLEGVSRLSPYLHFGEISSRMIWHAILERYSNNQQGVECYLRQLGWREFAYHLLYHFPATCEQPLRREFTAFPWNENSDLLKAWHKGKTGYPFVDAGMRQLWQTGWMHNRLRMIVGSFLVKDLLISWVEGARWFWDTLVDADLANNTLGWQWVAGCGADAAPYFRIFNPVTQGEKFDPEGNYVRQWVPELAKVPSKWIHQPWNAPPLVLKQSGVALGETYPYPIVDHNVARKHALSIFNPSSP